MWTLGVGGSEHDFSFALMHNDKLVIAIEEERLSREKHSIGPRSHLFQGIHYCLNYADIQLNDVNQIIGNDLLDIDLMRQQFSQRTVRYINHHLAHAAAAYYTSGFDDCVIFIADGNGSQICQDEYETISLAYVSSGKINIIKRITGKFYNIKVSQNLFLPNRVLNSLGSFYEVMTAVCGFHPLEQGKLMGLASYGTARYVDVIRQFFGKDMRTLRINLNRPDFIANINKCLAEKRNSTLFQARADLAYATQFLLEEAIFVLLNDLYMQYPCNCLCLGGGVALNSTLNGKLLKRTPYKYVYIFPAAGDSGTSVGAAMYAVHNWAELPLCKRERLHTAFLGRRYGKKEIQAAIYQFKNKISFIKYDEKEYCQYAAEDLVLGKVIGWFQDNCEFGPRALGNRSILADPRQAYMKDYINHTIKHREMFRPFAPSILAEYLHTFFECDQDEYPFMTFTCKIKDSFRNKVPAIVHVDNTARVQTVTEVHGRYRKVIEAFYQMTSVPLILNTSFNIKGQPIVETPVDALRSFIKSSLDVLYIGDYRIEKKKTDI